MEVANKFEAGEDGDDDSKEFSDGYDENLLGDEEDRRRLGQMTEKEREQELFNRSERRETLKTRFEIERKLRSKAKKRDQPEKKPPKQVRNRKRLRASEIYSSDGSSDESDEYTPDTNSKILNDINTGEPSNTKMTTRSALLASSPSSSSRSSSASSGSSESLESSSSESDAENGAFQENEDSPRVEDNYELTLTDLRSLQLKRDRIEEWIYAPFFKETAIGLFVKISVGNHPQTKQHMYKVGQIVDITKGSRVYPLNNGKNKTDKQCVVRIGRVERTFQMSFVSNRSFDDDDYSRWRDLVQSDGQITPSREGVLKKKQDLNRAINFEFKDEDIAYQVAERSRFNDIPHNFALKKTELMAERADAEAAYDFDKVREIQAKIDDLEERARELERLRSSEKFSGISIVNERNRAKNIVESERVLKESKNVKTEDPFTRRKCTPTIVHNKNTNEANKNNDKKEPGQNGDNPGDSKSGSNGNMKHQDQSQSEAASEVVKSANDLFQVHAAIDLELDIDI